MASRSAVYGDPADHGSLYRSHDLSTIDSKGGEAKDAIAVYFYQRLQESTCFREGAGSKHMCPWGS